MNHSMMMAAATTVAASMNHDHHHHHNHQDMSGMNHTMTTAIPPHNHAGHNMSSMGGHDGHDMSSMGGHGGHDMNSMGHGGMMGHMMKMYFHTGNEEYVLFESCFTTNDKEIVLACVVIFLLAVLYEGIKFIREVLLQRSMLMPASMYIADGKMSTGTSQEQMVIRGPNSSVSSQMLSQSHVIQTGLHMVQIFLSYCLMLVFMTYNVWLCLAVVLGAGVGYFVFGWKRASVVDANEHCH